MKTVRIEELNAETFQPFGFFARLIDPAAEKIGASPIEFYRDMAQLDLGGASIASFSTCRVEPREPVIDVTEYHSYTGEGILPLDGDILIHAGPATPPDSPPPIERFRVFRVPRGTMVCLRPGVWHHAPFAIGKNPVNVLIVLPERTYANDCVVVELAESEQLGISEG
jgi:ureidoglycolate lyase